MHTVLLRVIVVLASLASPARAPDPAPEVSVFQGEAIYPRTSSAMWEDVLALASGMKFGVERKDAKHQVLITRWIKYDVRRFPSIEALELLPSDRPVRVQFHVMVFPGRDPARVAVGSIIELVRHTDGLRSTVRRYRASAVEEWFLQALGARAGVAYEPTAAAFAQRSEQVARLMPAGAADSCPAGIDGTAPVAHPRLISEVQPIMPAEGSGSAVVHLTATVTEHGTIGFTTVMNPSKTREHYEAAARAAAGLWRFEPARRSNCPIVSVVEIEMTFTTR